MLDVAVHTGEQASREETQGESGGGRGDFFFFFLGSHRVGGRALDGRGGVGVGKAHDEDLVLHGASVEGLDGLSGCGLRRRGGSERGVKDKRKDGEGRGRTLVVGAELDEAKALGLVGGVVHHDPGRLDVAFLIPPSE